LHRAKTKRSVVIWQDAANAAAQSAALLKPAFVECASLSAVCSVGWRQG